MNSYFLIKYITHFMIINLGCKICTIIITCMVLIQAKFKIKKEKSIERNYGNNEHRITSSTGNTYVISGIGIVDIYTETYSTIYIRVKDSNGINVPNPTEIFSVKVSNLCTKDTDHYCSVDSSGLPLLSSINGMMIYK